MMKAFATEVAVTLADIVASDRVLFSADQAKPGEEKILDVLEDLPDGGLLVIDLGGVLVSSEAARRLLRRAIQRVAGGELTGRSLVLSGLGASSYNVDVMLQGENLVAVERRGDGESGLVGRIEPAVKETYEYLLTRAHTTANDVKRQFGLENISTATNRLTKLWKLALARRVEEQTVVGGGKQYVYAPVK